MEKALTFLNYKINNNADESCDIYIDGIIVDASTEQIIRDWWNDDTPTSFKSVRNQISRNAKTVNVYINSSGGQVVEAMAIHDYLKSLQQNGVKVNTFGRGLIASAATYILMSSQDSTISENSWFMVHNVSGGIYGDVNEIENYATTMRKFNDQITEFYSTHTGLSNTVVKNMMNKETWFSGKEAVEKGFVKNVESVAVFENKIDPQSWMFNNKQVVEAYNSFTTKTINMDIKKAVQEALNNLGFGTKPTNELNSEQVANAIAETLKPLTNIDQQVADAVTNALKDKQFLTADAITNMATKDMLENYASKKDVEDLTQTVTDMKSGEAGGAGAGAGGAGAENKGVTWE